MTKLSIIVPVYNVENYIRPCFESIFKQGLDDDDYEIIIVNDGSTDNSMKMIDDLISQHKNITIINQKNQGLSVARNNGITASKGEYILMPDSDDLLVEGSLKPILEKALETRDDMVIADFLRMDDNEIQYVKKTLLKQPTFLSYEKTGEQFLLEDMLPTECYVWRTLFRRSFLIDNNISFYPGIYFQDIPFTHECYLKAKKCLRFPRLLNIYRKGHGSAATAPSSFSEKKARDLCVAITTTWELTRLKNISPAIIKKLKSNIYALYTNFCYRILHFSSNRKDAIKAIRFLNQQAPDLRFSSGFLQIIGDFLRRKMPRIYLALLSFKWSMNRFSPN